MHITERFWRTNFGHMDIEVTIDDPQMYTRPFTVKFPAPVTGYGYVGIRVRRK